MLPSPPILKHRAGDLRPEASIRMNSPRARSTNTLRIIAGQWRSRRLAFPDVEGLRPTADRIRETLFNWLQERIAREDCLDLFAGSGACGMEALSRGARHVTFVDSASAAASSIRHNLDLLKAEGGQVVCEDSLRWLQRQDAEAAKAFWQGELAGLEGPVLLADPQQRTGTDGYAKLFTRLDAQRTAALVGLAYFLLRRRSSN